MRFFLERLLQTLGAIFILVLVYVAIQIPLHGISWAEAKKTYEDISWEVQSRLLENKEDCEGEILVKLGDVNLRIPRTEKGHIRFERNTYDRYLEDVLTRPNPYFGCNKTQFTKAISLSLRTTDWNIDHIGFSKTEKTRTPKIFEDKRGSRYLTEMNKKRYFDSNDRPLKRCENFIPEKYWKETEYDNGVTKLETHNKIYFILPYDQFPTLNQERVPFVCDRVWMDGSMHPPKKCIASYYHPSGIIINYEALYKSDMENFLLDTEKDFRSKLEELIEN